ncbi:hypothetical protein BDM02DRAFT_1275385 [Thelephora ganbajun]|uniref:Uncharacterized protein n=1 Tax=Thelephora ganbajun TaxID=370292 RepID=A0ACB6Z340_THEGA|nr:hypothetical protein BDM02DRAFT_1275385 [Thelephora ganbajun]
MGCREFCPCCFQMVTKAQLKRHAEEVARQQSGFADPTIISSTVRLRVKPITGDDIFGPQASAPTPAPPVDNGTFYPEISAGPPLPVASPPYFIPLHSIEDDDFPLDPVEHPRPPSRLPDYPSIETSDVDEHYGEAEEQDKGRTEDGFSIMNDEKSSMYHSFWLSPPTPNNNTIAGPGPQTIRHRRDRPGGEPSASPAAEHAIQFLPHFITENPVPGPAFQPIQPQRQRHLPSYMSGFYSFEVGDKHLKPPNGDEDGLYGPEN